MDLEQFTASPSDVAAHYAGKPKSTSKRKTGAAKAATKADNKLPRHSDGDRFVKGPIPLDWIKAASRCGHRAEAVALLVWYAAGVQRANPCKLSPRVLAELHVHPRTAKRILERFVDAGLATVKFHRGRSPLVTITSPTDRLTSTGAEL
jgi:hypothetical protein